MFNDLWSPSYSQLSSYKSHTFWSGHEQALAHLLWPLFQMVDAEDDEDGQVVWQQDRAYVCGGLGDPVYAIVVGTFLGVEAIGDDWVEDVKQVEDESYGVGEDYHKVLIKHLNKRRKVRVLINLHQFAIGVAWWSSTRSCRPTEKEWWTRSPKAARRSCFVSIMVHFEEKDEVFLIYNEYHNR